MEGTTLVLHLEPVGLPLDAPPADEATLKEAIRGVLLGIAALHRAGVVRGAWLQRSPTVRVWCCVLPSFINVDAAADGGGGSFLYTPSVCFACTGFVHRDVRWRNVIRVPELRSSGSLSTYVLIDLEHAGMAGLTAWGVPVVHVRVTLR